MSGRSLLIAVCGAVLMAPAGCERAHTEPLGPVEKEWSRVADPGRGFYRHTERRSAADPAPGLGTLREWRREGITLVMRVCYLGEHRDGAMSDAYLDALRADFGVIREAGMKVIVRFAYSSSMEGADSQQAGEPVVLRHVEQLAPVLAENADVLHCLQAGFLGAWGEWHAVHPDFQAPDGSLSAPAARRLLSALLKAVPEPVHLQVRTPWQKMMLFEDDMPGADRVGHHNDCFLASPNDVGTYRDREGEIAWLEQETRTLPMGGETCGVHLPRSSGGSALKELARLHFNYLNLDYHPDVLDGWRRDGSFDEIAARLGHRLRLESAEEGPAGVKLVFLNEGFAAPLRNRPLEWRNGEGEVRVVDGFSARSLDPGERRVVELAGASLPLEIRLPDPSESLRPRGDYATRIVNLEPQASGWHRIPAKPQLAK